MVDARELLMDRFPLLGLGIDRVEPHPLPLENEGYMDPGKAEIFYCCGLNPSVYIQSKEWLQGEKQLVFLEEDLGKIAAFLNHPLAIEILSNANIHIENSLDFEALANRYPVQRIEISGLSEEKRLELLRKTTLAHALHIDRLYGYQPFQNFLWNLKHLPRSFYLNSLKNGFKNVPAVICGAGPSLEDSLDVLKGLENRALIIAGGSTLAALSSKGIMPHFGVAVDPNVDEYHRFKNSFAFEVPLIYSTRVHPNIFNTCNGPFGYMRSGIGGILELWIEEELGLQEPLIGEFLPSETISVTGISIAIAQYLGCNPILLNGIDLAYTDGLRYASGVTESETLYFDQIDDEKKASDRIIQKNGVTSAVRWVMESESISEYREKHKEIRFINTTTKGLGFRGMETMPIEKAVADFQSQDLKIFEKIDAARMPENTQEKLKEKMGELKKSLARTIEYLEILSGEKKGIAALAEMDLMEETAMIYLFYDIRQIFKPGPTFWLNFLCLAKKYQVIFNQKDF